MSDTASTAFEQLCQFNRETSVLESIEELLGWDERTMLPPAGGGFRAEQITYLSGMVHRRRTNPLVGQWLEELLESPLAAEPHSDTSTTIRQIKRDYEKRTKLPQSLVEELARTAVLGQQAWTEARKNNDFASFRPLLEKTYELKRQQAEAIGYDENPYGALLDDYEPDVKTADIKELLTGLREQLTPFVSAIANSDRPPQVELLRRPYPTGVQEAFGKQAAAAIGFDFQRGRLDVTHHPFCAGVGPDDCRITTRYDDRNFPSALFGILHEAGHGIYEQGLRKEQFGLPPGTYVSLGIHESQSRLWENAVGRSHAFWRHFFSPAQSSFTDALGDVSLDEFYFAINDVRPSLIRVEADEATYNLHIIIRFELEQALLADDLPVADLPTAWKDKYRDYLGVEPPDDADGVLQDIHWSAGLVGYFPTYSLGNLYAAQFFAQADDELGGLDEHFARGDFAGLREWLREKIHRHGQCYTASELIQRVTSKPLSHEPLMDYLRRKLEPLYGI